MSDLNREFELEIWRSSLSFGLQEGCSITTTNTSVIPYIGLNYTTKNKGDVTDAILGRIIKRTSTTQK